MDKEEVETLENSGHGWKKNSCHLSALQHLGLYWSPPSLAITTRKKAVKAILFKGMNYRLMELQNKSSITYGAF
jgi:hypothetical protein